MIEDAAHSDSMSQSFSTLIDGKILKTLSVLIALFLTLAGLLKVFSPTAVINTSSELFPWAGNTLHIFIGSLLPVIELGLGIMLLLQWQSKWVLSGITVLFSLFFLVSIYGQATGVDADCGCFGDVITSSFGWGMLTRNGILLVLVIYLTRHEIKRGGEDE